MEINWRKVIWVLVILLVIGYVVGDPTSAAGLVGDFIDWLKSAGDSLIVFIKTVFAGL